MNQIKIGKFIAKCRKEKGFTQQELADKLGVTDKAISKWENGRSLMDISLLNPLSECLDVSIVELINGEKIVDNDVSIKSGEAVERTLNYAKEKIKNIKIKLILVSFLACFVLIFFVYKSTLLYFYSLPKYSVKKLEDIVSGLKVKDSIFIYKKTIPESEYIIIDSIKIENVFSEFDKLERLNDNYPHQFVLRDNMGKTVGAITISDSSLTGNLIDIFVSDSLIFMRKFDGYSIDVGQFNNADRKDFLLQNDINNDADFIKYISENCYVKNNIFTSPKKMKENYAINLFASVAVPKVNNITLIEGDYVGYIYNHDRYRGVNILRGNKTYYFTFMGENFISDEYIISLLSTLDIK